MLNRIQALIFDCDGTLADTMPLHWRAWQIIAARHRLHLPEERFYALGGVPSREIVKMLSVEQGLQLDHLAVAREKEAEYLPLIAQVEPINAVVGVARANFGKLPMAVASGGERYVVERTLLTIGIHDMFDAIVSADDVEHGKPSPDIFLESARRLNVEPEHCLVFEDADLGLQAASRANMRAIDVRKHL